jgi:hypothetical protein
MVEVFKDIVGYEGLYQVSNLGRVKSLERTKVGKCGSVAIVKERILKPADNGHGYLFVILCKDSVLKTHKVHRLVCEAFIPNPNNLPQVGHLDESRDNNCVDNLYWTTAKDNCNMPLHKERISNSNSKAIYCPELDKTFNSLLEAAEYLGCDVATVCNHLKGRLKSVCKKKYHLQYANEVAV